MNPIASVKLKYNNPQERTQEMCEVCEHMHKYIWNTAGVGFNKLLTRLTTFCGTQAQYWHYPWITQTNEDVPLFTLDTFPNKNKRLRWRKERLLCGGIFPNKEDIPPDFSSSGHVILCLHRESWKECSAHFPSLGWSAGWSSTSGRQGWAQNGERAELENTVCFQPCFLRL